MRLMLSSLLAASLMASPVLAAECIRPAEHTALDVTALKTQLMVMALTCQADERYNAFVTKYRPDLTQADKSLAAYFARGSRNGTKLRDDYVTQLANAQSQSGMRQGSVYCAHNMVAFDEVMALRNNAELTEFAAAKEVADQPISVHDCGAVVERTHTTSHTTARRRS